MFCQSAVCPSAALDGFPGGDQGGLAPEEFNAWAQDEIGMKFQGPEGTLGATKHWKFTAIHWDSEDTGPKRPRTHRGIHQDSEEAQP